MELGFKLDDSGRPSGNSQLLGNPIPMGAVRSPKPATGARPGQERRQDRGQEHRQAHRQAQGQDPGQARRPRLLWILPRRRTRSPGPDPGPTSKALSRAGLERPFTQAAPPSAPPQHTQMPTTTQIEGKIPTLATTLASRAALGACLCGIALIFNNIVTPAPGQPWMLRWSRTAAANPIRTGLGASLLALAILPLPRPRAPG